MQTENTLWFLKTIEETISGLNSTKKGLSSQEAEKRLEKYGKNTLAEEESTTLFKIILRNFNSILIYILLASAIISLISDHLVEFYVVMILITLTVFLGVIQEYRAGKSLNALKSLTAKRVDVYRDEILITINATDLVVGDVVVLRRGMIVPADLRLIESNSLIVDESILTGESTQKSKLVAKLTDENALVADRTNILFSGTNITGGKGIGIVVQIGINSEIGKISQQLKQIGDQPSPLQQKITVMSRRLSYLVIGVCVLMAIVLSLRGSSFFDMMLIVSAVAVSGIPESFPLALTLSLSNGVKNMSKKNAIIRDLSSVETLGTTTVICTDKTGTLTENKMVVEKIYFADGFEVDVKGEGYAPNSLFFSKSKQLNLKKLNQYDLFFRTCILCNNSELAMKEGNWSIKGESTEGALLALAKSTNLDDLKLREEYKLIREIPFDPSKKFMITINKNKKGTFAYLKGSAERVLEKSTFIRKGNKLKKLTKKELSNYHEIVKQYSSQGYRVLAIGTKKLSSTKFNEKLKNYVFEGLVAIRDPIRQDVFDSVKECMSAGIRVIMVTGDHRNTAEAIGNKLGLITYNYDKIIEGQELEKMDDVELDRIIEHVAIFARTTPEHKLRIVSSLQRKGEIVAMTGDGVNDAPSLKKADIGISMGMCGTEVARESSNMILVDDNFSTIVNAIKEGRTIYSNIRRFVYYLLLGNFTEVSVMLFAVLFDMITPLSAIMILFVNIVTSTLPSLSLSIEPTHDKIMKQKPRDPKENLLSKYILLKIFVLAPILFLGTMLMFQMEFFVTQNIDKARTVAFVTLIFFELFHTFNARSLHISIFNSKFFSNKYLFYSLGASILITILTIHTTIGNFIFKTVPLTFTNWIIILVLTSSVVWISELIKLLIKSEFQEQMHLKGMNQQLE